MSKTKAMADAIEEVEGRVRAVAAAVVVAGLLCAIVMPALAEDRIAVPCEEHKRVTGEDLCHVHPTLSWTRAHWEAAKDAPEKYHNYITREGRVPVPCEEHQRLTGQDLCHSLPTLYWKRADWEGLKAGLAQAECRDAVWRKYAVLGK